MPDRFEEALERLDVVFGDFFDMDALISRLDDVLGRTASMDQIQAAAFALGQQKIEAVLQGFTVDRFMRGGRSVTQLRDVRGRFVTEGAANISARLARGAP